MKRWQKTEMVWSCHPGSGGIKTGVPITDWPDATKTHFHVIIKLVAISMPNRTGKIELEIGRAGFTSPRGADKQKLYDMLSNGMHGGKEVIFSSSRGQGGVIVKNAEELSGTFVITLELADGDHFCDVVLEVVRVIFEILGVEDEKTYKLADFSITQETLVWFGEAWITYARWLRVKHGVNPFTSEEVVASMSGLNH